MNVDDQVRQVRDLLDGPARRGASSADIATAEHRLGLRLPDDVLALVRTFDGSDSPTSLEHGWVTFWPLSRWRRVSDDPDMKDSLLGHTIMFADHSLSSWFYALEMDRGTTRSAVYLIGGTASQPPLVSDSLSGFLQAVIDDGDVLYQKALSTGDQHASPRAPRFVQSNSVFAMTCTVEIDISATPELVWGLLTHAKDFPRWNSTVTAIDGEIREGERLTLHVPGTQQTFTPRVSGVVAPQRMTWSNGFNPVFKGVRSFSLEPVADGTTRFVMREHFSGLVFALTKRMLPDFRPIFETYAHDLKREAERISSHATK